MKKLFKVTAVLAFMFAFAHKADAALFGIPRDLNGNLPADGSLVGVDVIDSTGTQNYGLEAPCLLHWVAISSAAGSTFALLRDTGTLNSTSDIKMEISAVANTTGSVVMYTFDPPAIFRNGLSITLNEATVGRFMFGVRRLLDTSRNAHQTAGTSASD